MINDSFNLAYGCKHMRTNSKDITQTKAVATQTHEHVGAYSKVNYFNVKSVTFLKIQYDNIT